jgi:uncharacterized SAM-binding protein YcdF (DUF218 family)
MHRRLRAMLSPNPYVTPSQLIIFTLFVLFLAVFVLWRGARMMCAVVGLAFFWLLAAGWLTAPLLACMQNGALRYPPPRFGERTVIVVLGAGTRYDAQGMLVPKHDAMQRIATAASLYARCKQEARHCQVVVSGGNPQEHEAAEADNYAPYLLRAHVARDDLVLENKSRTTYENAQYVARILRNERYDSLMLVTSAYHMPRALLDFRRFALMPAPVASSARVVQRGVVPHWKNLVAANIALHELIGMVQFYVYRAVGWF